jgi:hypothetical protein
VPARKRRCASCFSVSINDRCSYPATHAARRPVGYALTRSAMDGILGRECKPNV